MKESRCLDRIPAPDELKLELGKRYRETRLLRRLLDISEQLRDAEPASSPRKQGADDE